MYSSCNGGNIKQAFIKVCPLSKVKFTCYITMKYIAIASEKLQKYVCRIARKYKNDSWMYDEGTKAGDTLLLIPAFKFSISVEYRGNEYLNLTQIYSIHTIYTIYNEIGNSLK